MRRDRRLWSTDAAGPPPLCPELAEALAEQLALAEQQLREPPATPQRASGLAGAKSTGTNDVSSDGAKPPADPQPASVLAAAESTGANDVPSNGVKPDDKLPARAPRRKPKAPRPRWQATGMFLCAWVASEVLGVAVPKNLHNLLLLTLVNRPTRQGAATRWTLRALQHWVKEQWGRDYSTETLRQVLRRLGFSWKKARKLLVRANTLARLLFLQQLEPLLQEARRGLVLLAYIDEAHIHCDCDLGYAWGRRGQPLLIHSTSPGLSHKVTFYGIYLLPLTQAHIWPAPCADSEQTIQILLRLRQQYPTQRLVLLWDGASYHRSQAVRDKATELGITLMLLPGYSPDFMPVEALWRWLRQMVTGNHCHKEVSELLNRVAAFAALINLDPDALAARLALKTSLNPLEEELRISNWF